MKQAEIKAIGDFLSDVYEGICERTFSAHTSNVLIRAGGSQKS
jgi:hypothetical protein